LNSVENIVVHAKYDHVIGADGIFSKVCDVLSEKNLVAFDRTTLPYGYKELTIPPTDQGEYALPNHHVHVWSRQCAVLIALPTREKSFVATLFFPLSGHDSIELLSTPDALNDFFDLTFHGAREHMPNLAEDFFQNPTSKITYLKGGPWHFEDKVLLIGDAAHAITPFYAMGMNVGFEDSTILMEILEEYGFDFGKAFAAFSERRKPDTDAIADLSLKNLTSISESPDPRYHFKWELERRIWDLLPEDWTPAYVQIAFTHAPIASAIRLIEKQDKVLKALMQMPDIETIDDETLTERTKELLKVSSKDIRASVLKDIENH
jgi:kynurenine 3-monooxygenase